jgi:hypothetical protein
MVGIGSGLRSLIGGWACPPYSKGPYQWDQFIQFTAGISGTMKGVGGYIYYIDEENGSDSNNGLSPNKAFATLDKCWGNTTGNKMARDNYDDDAEYHVFIFPGTYAPLLPLRVYGHGIHIIGLGIPGTDSGVNITDTAAVAATYGLIYWAAANSSIQNVQFNMTTNIPAMNLLASDNCAINYNVYNSINDASTKGITLANVRQTEIAHNLFGIAGGCHANAIYSTSGADQYLIDSHIHDNRIYSDVSGAVGIVVHSDFVAYGTVIDKNHINLAGCAGTPIGIDWNATATPLITNNYVTVPTSKTPIESAASPTGILHNSTQAGSTEVDPNTAAG